MAATCLVAAIAVAATLAAAPLHWGSQASGTAPPQGTRSTTPMAPPRRWQPVAASSGTHLWWISHPEAQFDLLHHAAASKNDQLHLAASFADKPIGIAADGDRVWVAFAANEHRMEVVVGGTQFNPATGLWFTTPNGAPQITASLAGDAIDSFAAIDGEPWAIVAGEGDARRLRGGQWNCIALPAAINACTERSLVVAGGVLNALGRGPDKSVRRFKRIDEQWIESPLDAPGFLYAVDHAARFACVTEGNPVVASPSENMSFGEGLALSWAEAGALARVASVPDYFGPVLGLGEGFAAVRERRLHTQMTRITQSDLAVLPQGATAFSQPVRLRSQSSTAYLWYHLPVLGALSLAAVLAAMFVRMLTGPPARHDATPAAPVTPHWTPLPKGRRMLAAWVDLFPLICVWVYGVNGGWVFDALIPPILIPDFRFSIGYILVVFAATVLCTLQEIAFGRSVGKFLAQAKVVSIDGSPAAWWQHIVRNLLKGLVLLSPVLVIPSLFSPRGAGIPEIVSRTAVVSAPRDLSPPRGEA
jgi:uncharacterized RDD family membrane protein YckC